MIKCLPLCRIHTSVGNVHDGCVFLSASHVLHHENLVVRSVSCERDDDTPCRESTHRLSYRTNYVYCVLRCLSGDASFLATIVPG